MDVVRLWYGQYVASAIILTLCIAILMAMAIQGIKLLILCIAITISMAIQG